MTNLQRAAALGFFLIVMLGVRQVAHLAVAGGTVPWLVLMGAIFSIGVMIENRDRRRDGRPAYSLSEARELLWPAAALAGILALAWLFS